MKNHSHSMYQIPEGSTVGDLLPQWSGVEHLAGPIGQPQGICPSCSSGFSQNRPRGMTLRLYPSNSPIPIAHQYDVCNKCTNRYRAGGIGRNQVLQAIQEFFLGKEF
jgi:hypothetical protein